MAMASNHLVPLKRTLIKVLLWKLCRSLLWPATLSGDKTCSKSTLEHEVKSSVHGAK